MAAATSSGVPARPRTVAPSSWSLTLAPSGVENSGPFSSGVSIGPGATALTRTPYRADSRATAFVQPRTPAFAAEYAAPPGAPTLPDSLATLTMAPERRSYIERRTARVHD